MKRAETLSEIKGSLDPSPLTLDQLAEFFVETSDARDPHLSRRLELVDRLATADQTKVLLAGHAGSGKSTELVKFQEEQGDLYLFVELSLTREAQPGGTGIEALLVLIVEAILRAIGQQEGLSLGETALRSVYAWFDETFEIQESELKYTGSVGAGADMKDSLWGKLLGLSAYLKADIKTGSGVLNKTITRENKRLSQLAFQCGVLIKEAQLAVRQAAGKEILLIVEDMDKVTVAEADALLIESPSTLAELPCKSVFTAPVFLFCNPRAAILDSHFEVVTIPMIKVEERDGGRCEEGRETITEILRHRVDLESLIQPEALDLVIEKTGGVLRHLFLALQHAVLTAGQAVRRGVRSESKITAGDARYGLNRLKSDLLRRIGVMGLPEEFEDITTQDLYDRLKELVGQPRSVSSDRVNLLLLQAHALIEYNGEQWHRVHPLVAEHIEFL